MITDTVYTTSFVVVLLNIVLCFVVQVEHGRRSQRKNKPTSQSVGRRVKLHPSVFGMIHVFIDVL